MSGDADPEWSNAADTGWGHPGDRGTQMKASLPNRRHVIHERVGPFIVSVGFDPGTGYPCEIFLSKRAKPGSELDDHLFNLGVAASRIMQGRNS